MYIAAHKPVSTDSNSNYKDGREIDQHKLGPISFDLFLNLLLFFQLNFKI